MGNDLKETLYAPATEAEISQLSAGQATQPSEDPDAARDRLSSLQEPPSRPSRLSDLRVAAAILKGRKVAAGVEAICVPGSSQVKKAAEAEAARKALLGLSHGFTE